MKYIKGDYVSAKNWSGEHLLGIYEYQYLDGEHCITNAKNGRKFCAHHHDVRMATEEQVKEIKKLMKENKDPIEKLIEENELDDALKAIE